MRYQTKDKPWCGPAAIVNAARVHGDKVSERKAKALCGTTDDGTNEDGMIAGIKGLGYGAHPYCSPTKQEALNWLTGAIANGQSVVITVENDGHWVAIVAKVGNKFILVDSQNTKKNISENGIWVLSPRKMIKEWKSQESGFYGIAISKKRTTQE
jgi:ABC-type bacteriocin/lantibiotic exporter with double-glycine peptidase domain